MATQTSMLHIRIDEALKTKATAKLASFGLTVSDAVRMLLTRVATEGALPAELTADKQAYETWFRAKVQQALDETRPITSHTQMMDEAQTLIDRKRNARGPN